MGIIKTLIESGHLYFQGNKINVEDLKDNYNHRLHYPTQEPETLFRLPARFVETNFGKVSIHKNDYKELNDCLKYIVCLRTFCLSISHKYLKLIGFGLKSNNDEYNKGLDVNRIWNILEEVQKEYIALFLDKSMDDMGVLDRHNIIRKKPKALKLSEQIHNMMIRVYGRVDELYGYIQEIYDSHSGQLNYTLGDININIRDSSKSPLYGEILIYMKHMLLPRIQDLYEKYVACVRNVQIIHQSQVKVFTASDGVVSQRHHWEPIDLAYNALLNDITKSLSVIDDFRGLANLLIELESILISLLQKAKFSCFKERTLKDLFILRSDLPIKWTGFKLED